MSKRHQNGYLFRKGAFWYVRFYDDITQPDGRIVRRQVCRQVAPYSDRYRNEKDVRPLLDAILRPLNEGRSSPHGTMAVAAYVEKFFLPHAEAEYKPSTVNGYKALWRMYLAPRLQCAVLRDYRCVDATRLLGDIHAERGIGRKTLRHCKALLSSVFKFAKQQGVIDSLNPVKDAGIPRRAANSKPTHAATPDEVLVMLDTLTGAARTAVALIYFAGLRPGEARGMRWEHYDGRRLYVRQSVWRTHLTEPKTEESVAPIPVCEPLAAILNEGRRSKGFILAGPSGKPANLNNLARRVVLPELRKAGIPWYGWYALRRGIATLATAVESPLAAKGLLRHSNLATTEKHYVKDSPVETQRAVEKIQALFSRAKCERVQ
ncbi:MAG TPA: hypothetical protein VHM88_05305 [Candidatus Acidoferrales bacterium]|jgi:integrase|nr:hypothetical protein [Candidatus Acidoferrales bacterium]